MEYRGYEIERFGDGWMVEMYGEMIYADSLKEMHAEIDSMIDYYEEG